MARKAYVPGLAALLVAFVAGCTAGGGADGSSADAKPGESSASAPPPGKYRTLPEPCGSVPRSALKDLLPGVDTLPPDQQEKVYRGTPSVTYDTDRRVGCSWKADSASDSHQLALDIERVVSYDPTVSDDSQAQEIYTKKEIAADLPSPATSSLLPSPPSGGPGAPSTTTESGSGKPPTPTATESPSGDPADDGLEPRLLDGLGNAAFLNDVLTGSGSAMQYRTVSVVFRTSNVIVTVRYTEQPTLSTAVPDSKKLQEKAQGLAKQLSEQLNQ